MMIGLAHPMMWSLYCRKKGFRWQPTIRRYPVSMRIRWIRWQEAVQDADALVYLTVQEEFIELDWDKILEQMKPKPVIYDSKNRIPLRINEKATLLRL